MHNVPCNPPMQHTQLLPDPDILFSAQTQQVATDLKSVLYDCFWMKFIVTIVLCHSGLHCTTRAAQDAPSLTSQEQLPKPVHGFYGALTPMREIVVAGTNQSPVSEGPCAQRWEHGMQNQCTNHIGDTPRDLVDFESHGEQQGKNWRGHIVQIRQP